MSDKQQEWEVQKILQRGKFNNVIHYLVLWKGYQISEATWEPISNLKNCEQAIVQFQSILNLQKKSKINPKNRKRLKVQNIFTNQINKFVNCVKIEEHKNGYELQQDEKLKQPMNEKQLQTILRDNFEQEKNPINAIKQTQQNEDTLDKSQQLPQIPENNTENIPENNFKRDRQIIHEQQQDNDILEGKIQKKIKIDQININQILKQIQINHHHHVNIKEEQSNEKQPNPSQQNKNIVQLNIIDKSQKIIQNFIQKDNSIYNQEINNNKQDLIKEPNLITQDQRLEDKFIFQNKYQNNDLFIDDKNKVIQNYGQKQPCLQKSNKQELENHKEPIPSSFKAYGLQRYRFLDDLYAQNQKIYLQNILRKIMGKQRLKIKANMIDLTKNPQLISTLADIQFVNYEMILEKIEFLIKQQYGWFAVGRHSDLGDLMIDVNLIEQKSWKVVVQMMKKRNGEN